MRYTNVILRAGICFILFTATCKAAEQCASPGQVEDTTEQEMAEVNEVGRTAFLANAYRVLSERKASSPLFYDAFGHVFLNAFTQKHIEQLGEYSTIIHEMGHRTIWFDTKVKEAMAKGIAQIVLLGSGLDCRALRLYDPAVTFFELDQDSMLNYKVEKLNKTLGISRYPSRLIRGNYVELDIKKALLEQGYDITKPALFVWEGNSMYFTPEKTKEILAMVLREFPKSEIAFDCLTKEVSGGEPVTAETEWFWGMSYLFTSQAGVSQQWEGPCDTAQYARDVPFE
eukprot:1250839-Rhodomonas_salina.1